MKRHAMIWATLLALIVMIGTAAVYAESTPAPVAAQSSGPGFTETPTFDKIPKGIIKGIANGRPFEAKTVLFEPSLGKWCLVISDMALSDPLDLLTEGQSINIDLPEPPATGKKWSREMKYGDGYFQVQKTDKADDTTSWNADNAYVLEITRWDVKPYTEDEGMFQVGGKASGRVYIVYKGAFDMKDSWAAGIFTDVPVRYMGQPELKY